MTKLYIFRHSNKLSKDNKEWIESERYKQNPWDKLLSNIGIKNCEFMAEQIKLDNVIIYTSPLSRCIYTAINICKHLYNNGIKCKIRVENGLSKILDKNNKSKKQNIATHSLDNHLNKYITGNDQYIDTLYSQFKKNMLNNTKECVLDFVNNLIKQNNNAIIVSHSINCIEIINYLTQSKCKDYPIGGLTIIDINKPCTIIKNTYNDLQLFSLRVKFIK